VSTLQDHPPHPLTPSFLGRWITIIYSFLGGGGGSLSPPPLLLRRGVGLEPISVLSNNHPPPPCIPPVSLLSNTFLLPRASSPVLTLYGD